jgi:hypothetical protein
MALTHVVEAVRGKFGIEDLIMVGDAYPGTRRPQTLPHGD